MTGGRGVRGLLNHENYGTGLTSVGHHQSKDTTLASTPPPPSPRTRLKVMPTNVTAPTIAIRLSNIVLVVVK